MKIYQLNSPPKIEGTNDFNTDWTGYKSYFSYELEFNSLSIPSMYCPLCKNRPNGMKNPLPEAEKLSNNSGILKEIEDKLNEIRKLAAPYNDELHKRIIINGEKPTNNDPFWDYEFNVLHISPEEYHYYVNELRHSLDIPSNRLILPHTRLEILNQKIRIKKNKQITDFIYYQSSIVVKETVIDILSKNRIDGWVTYHVNSQIKNHKYEDVNDKTYELIVTGNGGIQYPLTIDHDYYICQRCNFATFYVNDMPNNISKSQWDGTDIFNILYTPGFYVNEKFIEVYNDYHLTGLSFEYYGEIL